MRTGLACTVLFHKYIMWKSLYQEIMSRGIGKIGGCWQNCNYFWLENWYLLMWSIAVWHIFAHISYKMMCCIYSEMHTDDLNNRYPMCLHKKPVVFRALRYKLLLPHFLIFHSHPLSIHVTLKNKTDISVMPLATYKTMTKSRRPLSTENILTLFISR